MKSPIRLNDELRIMNPKLSQFDMVYTLSNGKGLYRVYYKDNVGSLEDNSGDLLRLEGTAKKPEVREYNLVGGINPTEWKRSSLNKNMVVRISDGQNFSSIGEIVRAPSQIYLGDQLIVQSCKTRKGALVLSGIICKIDEITDFRKYAAKFTRA